MTIPYRAMAPMNLTTDRFDTPDGGTMRDVVCVNLPLPVAVALSGTRVMQQVAPHALAEACTRLDAQAVVACPLIWDGGDALCVLGTLRGAGFSGTVLVVTPPLPKPDMVEHELRAATGGGFKLRLLAV